MPRGWGRRGVRGQGACQVLDRRTGSSPWHGLCYGENMLRIMQAHAPHQVASPLRGAARPLGRGPGPTLGGHRNTWPRMGLGVQNRPVQYGFRPHASTSEASNHRATPQHVAAQQVESVTFR